MIHHDKITIKKYGRWHSYAAYCNGNRIGRIECITHPNFRHIFCSNFCAGREKLLEFQHQVPGKVWHISFLWVDWEFRNKGVGSKLIEMVRKEAEKVHVGVVLEALANDRGKQSSLVRFYHRCGFKKVMNQGPLHNWMIS
jgi:ribosomal protein S18 acetylase RimI-like enzyme